MVERPEVDEIKNSDEGEIEALSALVADGPCDLVGVREYVEEYPVELALRASRLVVRAYSEGGHRSVEIDLADLLNWLASIKL
jgi:hypothetical protein